MHLFNLLCVYRLHLFANNLNLSDKENELNTRNIELSDLILITVKGVDYAFHEPSKYVYDLQSYNYARTTQNLDDLRHIGIMQDGKLVFDRK